VFVFVRVCIGVLLVLFESRFKFSCIFVFFRFVRLWLDIISRSNEKFFDDFVDVAVEYLVGNKRIFVASVMFVHFRHHCNIVNELFDPFPVEIFDKILV
jgi:hypothetical protein